MLINNSQVVIAGCYIGMFVAENLFQDYQCLLVVFFCFIVLSKMPINNSQVVIAGCYLGMFVAENLFPDDQCLLVVFFVSWYCPSC